ncbi:MAG TPA: ATP-binding protein [Chthoniobacteraceae bacterium]|nr:ATP-binding protein [Chthoniobacteraceae bacterium]
MFGKTSLVLGYLLAVGSVGLALLVKGAFEPWFSHYAPLLPLVAAVLVTVVVSGWWPGVLAVVLGAGANLLFGLAEGEREIVAGQWFELGVFVLFSSGILYIVRASRLHHEETVRVCQTLADREARLQEVIAELKNAKEQAEAANLAKDRFLAALSHELRTPLTPVLLLAESLESRPDLPDDLRKDASVIRRHVALEARLIDDLIDLTRIEKGKLHLERRVVNLHDILDIALSLMSKSAEAKGVALEFEPEARQSFIYADRPRIKQVILNLVSNAIKFTPAGGKITVVSRNKGDRVVLSVTDTGIGIPREALATIFNAFEQADASMRRYGGLGLGLAITRTIAELHGGRVRAESEGPGRGATFTVELPVSEAPEVAPAEAQKRPDLPHSNLRILLVEDHEPTAFVLSRLLKRRGHDVTVALNLEEAKTHDQQPIDLLVSDIGLPDGSGNDLVRHYRVAQNGGFKAIALSGFGMEADVERSMMAGFDRHMTKPVDFERLQTMVMELFQSGERKSA